MKVLHTSDWHLGQRLKELTREEEQQLALDWLVDTIDTESVDVLVVSGDIFDTPTPSNAVREQYYAFLARLLRTSCQHVVLIAGNHDSASLLQAPQSLLRPLNIHIVATPHEDPTHDILRLTLRNGETLLVAAVPFLRDRDILRSVALESELTRVQRIQQGIIEHYCRLADALPEEAASWPVLATGHLYAAGAATSNDNKDNIYLGNLENIRADQFPTAFDYVALGHIHRAQPVQQRHIRYSGSLIPLSFKEAQEPKSVTLLTFDGKTLSTIDHLPVPTYRALVQLVGSLDEIKTALKALPAPHSFPTLVAIDLHAPAYSPGLERDLRDLAAQHDLLVTHIRTITPDTDRAHWTQDDTRDLADLTVQEVFAARCQASQLDEATTQSMTKAFNTLLAEYESQKNA